MKTCYNWVPYFNRSCPISSYFSVLCLETLLSGGNLPCVSPTLSSRLSIIKIVKCFFPSSTLWDHCIPLSLSWSAISLTLWLTLIAMPVLWLQSSAKIFLEKLKTQAKLDLTEKLWYLFFHIFWAPGRLDTNLCPHAVFEILLIFPCFARS